MKNITLAFVLLLTIVGGITFFLLYNSDNVNQISSSNIEHNDLATINAQGEEDLTTLNSEEQLQLQFHDEFREVLNLTFKTINAMVERDYTFISEISDKSVEINDYTLKFNSVGENGYEGNLLEDFDFKTLEYRGYHAVGDEMFIFLGIDHIAYEFTFIKGNSKHGNYLLKSIITN